MATTEETLADQISEIGLDKQNSAVIGRLLTQGGGIAHAEEDSDGRMHARIRIPEDELIWDPSILVIPHGGDIEIEFINDDANTHCALVPSNGDSQWLWLPNYTHGSVNINLDGPGYYWFSSNVGNDEGRGLIGVIAVLGNVPPEAQLDRPAQPRP